MSDVVLLGILTLIGTLSGTFGGILVAGKLTNYRISQLEKKVDKHNSLVEWKYCAEEKFKTLDERSRDNSFRIDSLE